jgi:tRNA(fMet)-specific endonuclease VapC
VNLILDTDHCVAILRGRLKWRDRVTPDTSLCITAVTVAELIFGAYRSDRLAENLALVDQLLKIVTLLPFDTDAARRHGELKDTLRRAGTPLADLDLQIACIALIHALPLATHNTNHFNRIPGLHLVDWLLQ